MQDTTRRLRLQARLISRGKAPTGIRYPPEFRAEAVAFARRLRSQGLPMVRIAKDLGVPSKTLKIWFRRRPTFRMRPVVVSTPPTAVVTAIRPVLVTVQGHRVEGLDLETLVQVLRSIS